MLGRAVCSISIHKYCSANLLFSLVSLLLVVLFGGNWHLSLRLLHLLLHHSWLRLHHSWLHHSGLHHSRLHHSWLHHHSRLLHHTRLLHHARLLHHPWLLHLHLLLRILHRLSSGGVFILRHALSNFRVFISTLAVCFSLGSRFNVRLLVLYLLLLRLHDF